MQPIEADYEDGVLRPTKPLNLKQGERVSVVVLRRPDAGRWNLERLAEKSSSDEASLTHEGLHSWDSDLDGEHEH
jgi:predicted DNA-binding antitoxin AbrB/MazE fold protein